MTKHFVVDGVAFGGGVDYFSFQVLRGGGNHGDGLVELGVELGAGAFDGFHAILSQLFHELIVDELHAFLDAFGIVGGFYGLEAALEVVDYG